MTESVTPSASSIAPIRSSPASSIAFLGILAFPLVVGCGEDIDPGAVMAESLEKWGSKLEQTSVSEYISRKAEFYQVFPYLLNYNCNGSETSSTSQAIVSSPVETDGNLLLVHANEQFWDIGAYCEHEEFSDYGFDLEIYKLFNDDRTTGTANFVGTVGYCKKYESCDVDFTLQFDLATGYGISAEGQLCVLATRW